MKKISRATAASKLGVCERTISRRIASGKLKAYRAAALVTVDEADIDRLLTQANDAGAKK